MRIAIIYFSGTGNTRYIAQKLGESLEKNGAACSVSSIEDQLLKSREGVIDIVDSVDKILIGYPIYGSKAPKIMETFIDHLPDGNRKKISVFTTVALYSGDGPIVYKEIFEDKGYSFESAVEFIMNNNFNVPGFPDVLRVGTDEKIKKRLDKADKKVDQVARAILSNNKIIQGDNIGGRLVGTAQRKHVDRLIKQINETMYVEEERCIHCKKCVKYCPVNNIKISKGKVCILDQCIGCMRCYHICPTEAINITKKSLDGKRWPRFKYNLS